MDTSSDKCWWKGVKKPKESFETAPAALSVSLWYSDHAEGQQTLIFNSIKPTGGEWSSEDKIFGHVSL